MNKHAFKVLVKRLIEPDHIGMIVLSKFVTFVFGLVVASEILSRHQVHLDHIGYTCLAVQNFNSSAEGALP